jgi:hypothetical protein
MFNSPNININSELLLQLAIMYLENKSTNFIDNINTLIINNLSAKKRVK